MALANVNLSCRSRKIYVVTQLRPLIDEVVQYLALLPTDSVEFLAFTYAAAATGFTGKGRELLFCLFTVWAAVPEELELFVGLTC